MTTEKNTLYDEIKSLNNKIIKDDDILVKAISKLDIYEDMYNNNGYKHLVHQLYRTINNNCTYSPLRNVYGYNNVLCETDLIIMQRDWCPLYKKVQQYTSVCVTNGIVLVRKLEELNHQN
jgi:hypothetical protein